MKPVPDGTPIRFKQHKTLETELRGLRGIIDSSYTYAGKIRYNITINGMMTGFHTRSDFSVITEENQ